MIIGSFKMLPTVCILFGYLTLGKNVCVYAFNCVFGLLSYLCSIKYNEKVVLYVVKLYLYYISTYYSLANLTGNTDLDNLI